MNFKCFLGLVAAVLLVILHLVWYYLWLSSNYLYIVYSSFDEVASVSHPQSDVVASPASPASSAVQNQTRSSNRSFTETSIARGGSWQLNGMLTHVARRPVGSKHRLALIVPYRNRARQLDTFIDIMSSFLSWNNMVDASIVVVEQCDSSPFNRAKLFNVGIQRKIEHADYFCFHDVDMIPANGLSGSLYDFPERPRHLAVNIQQFSFSMPFENYTGGVLCMSKEDVLKVNGWSNIFWGWGSEDNEMRIRIEISGLQIDRPEFALYWSLSSNHTQRDKERWTEHKQLAKPARVKDRIASDGLSSLEYRLVDSRRFSKYDWICADLLFNQTNPTLLK